MENLENKKKYEHDIPLAFEEKVSTESVKGGSAGFTFVSAK